MPVPEFQGLTSPEFGAVPPLASPAWSPDLGKSNDEKYELFRETDKRAWHLSCDQEAVAVRKRGAMPTYQYLSAGLVLCPGPAEAINTPKGLESYFF
jgi:hypothetical protein